MGDLVSCDFHWSFENTFKAWSEVSSAQGCRLLTTEIPRARSGHTPLSALQAFPELAVLGNSWPSAEDSAQMTSCVLHDLCGAGQWTASLAHLHSEALEWLHFGQVQTARK